MGPSEESRRQRAREAERYRQAALSAVEQLDWCIQYLYRLHKPQIAERIAHNRATIIERARLFN